MTDQTSIPLDSDMIPPPPPPPPAPNRRRPLLGRRGATAAIAGGLVVGGIAGGYVITQAATSSPSASATPSAGAPWAQGHRGAFGGPGGPAARGEDIQQAATALGITSAQLQTELSAGKTIAAVAKEHNVVVSKVIATLVTDENAEVDAAVSGGKLTEAQATQIKATTQQRVTDLVNGTQKGFGFGGPGGRGPWGGPGGGIQSEDQQVVASAIGITTTQLQTEQVAGKTIAAIAKEHNIDVSKVISALTASENSEIDQRIASGQITATQGAQEKTMTSQRITDEVNGTAPAGGWRGGLPPGAPSGTSTSPTS